MKHLKLNLTIIAEMIYFFIVSVPVFLIVYSLTMTAFEIKSFYNKIKK